MPTETAIMSYIEHIASISAAIAVIYTAWTGSRQISTWTKDKLFDRRVKHAIKVINMLHEAREVIHEARVPPMVGKKREEARSWLKIHVERRYMHDEKLKKKKLENRELLAVSNLHCMLKRKVSIFSNISNYTPTAKFVFDSDIQSLLNDLVSVYKDLNRDANRILISLDEEKHRDKINSLLLKNYRFQKRNENDESDEIGEKVDSIVDQIEVRIKKVMGTKE